MVVDIELPISKAPELITYYGTVELLFFEYRVGWVDKSALAIFA